MEKHASELSFKELAKAGAEAGAHAVAEAHAAGLAVTCYAEKPDGELWLGRLMPDGSHEWIKPVSDDDRPLKSSLGA